jgi:regulator of sigma E protease
MSIFDFPIYLADDFARTVISFLFVITLIVFFHELGHFLVGRWCGVRVSTFSIGFGPELFGWNDRSGTRWRLALLPLGGYVRFFGDADAASMPDPEAVGGMTTEERAVSFVFQPVWKRFLIVLAGPVASILLGIVIFSSNAYLYGRVILIPKVASVMAGSAAADAGFQAGDIILSVDGQPVENFMDVQRLVGTHAGVPLTFKLKRDGADIALIATPKAQLRDTIAGQRRMGVLGIAAARDESSLIIKQETLLSAISFGVLQSWEVIASSGDFISGLFVGRASPDQLSGPIGIAKMSGEVAKAGLSALIGFAGLISVSIGFLNLMPIPLLDGGHLVLYTIEAIRKKALDQRSTEVIFRIGLAFVICLTLFSLYVDLR